MPENRLQRLHDAGQSIWLDFIDRSILRNGDLARRIREDALTGMTSNPTIFEKALAEGHAYDDQLAAAPPGLTAMELSLNKVPPGRQSPFLHRHVEHEQLYLFVRGEGQMQVDGAVFDVREGTTVRVAPDGVRAVRNCGTEDLYYVCIQAKAGSLTGETISDGRRVDGPLVWNAPTPA